MPGGDLVATTDTDPELAGLWTLDVLIGWLRGLGIPHDDRVKLHRGPSWPSGTDRAGLVTFAPGNRGRSELDEAADSWPGFQLAFRGRQRTGSDRDAETLSRAADRRLMRTELPLWVPSGPGRVRLLHLVWSGAGPMPMGPDPERGERSIWAATYLTHVIEEF
jgi:hypothetical protein